jgi:hypothetical protein
MLFRRTISFSGFLFLAACNLNASAQVLTSYMASDANPSTNNALTFTGWFRVLGGGTSSSQLQIQLINTTSTGSNNRSDLLSGVFFNLSGLGASPALPASNSTTGVVTTLPSGSSTVHSSTGVTISSATNAAAGAFVFQDVSSDSAITPVGSTTPVSFQYGVNSTGYGSYGFSGFGAGNGSDDYTVQPNTSNTVNGGDVAVIKNGVFVTLSGFGSALTSTSQLSNVYFTVGSGTQTVGTAQKFVVLRGTQTPEPGPVGLMIGMAVTGAFCIRRRRRVR